MESQEGPLPDEEHDNLEEYWPSDFSSVIDYDLPPNVIDEIERRAEEKKAEILDKVKKTIEIAKNMEEEHSPPKAIIRNKLEEIIQSAVYEDYERIIGDDSVEKNRFVRGEKRKQRTIFRAFLDVYYEKGLREGVKVTNGNEVRTIKGVTPECRLTFEGKVGHFDANRWNKVEQ